MRYARTIEVRDARVSSELPPALDAEQRETNGTSGRLSYYVAGDGPPMLLLHSINAAGSAFEIRPVFDAMRSSHTVYAPDLPGFGHSERSARDYDIALYVSAVEDMLSVIGENHGGEAVDALALSLACEFLARSARNHPQRFRSLALVTPTGLNRSSSSLVGEEGETREMVALSAFLSIPGLRRGLFRLLTRPGVIRYFLKRTWGSDDFDESLAAYDDLTTHQPGAEHAPLAFLSGKLFSKDIRRVLESIDLPVWVPHGTRGDFRDFSGAEWTKDRDNWQLQPFDSGALPHYEAPDSFIESYRAFLEPCRDDQHV